MTHRKIAIIAPTIITEEIAFVTDIRGVCKECNAPNNKVTNKN